MQQRLRIAVRLGDTVEDEGAGGLEGETVRRVRGHRSIERITGVLGVDLGRHPQQGRIHLLRRADAMQQPVGHMLGRDAQGGAVLHQAHVVDVGHLGTADPLVDPADHIAEQALGVVVEFLGNVRLRPVGPVRQRRGQQILEAGDRPGGDRGAQGEDVGLVIVEGVQGRRRRAGRPGGVGTRLRMRRLLVEHVSHPVRGRPHPLADLGLAGQAAFQADGDVARLIGGDPGGGLDVALAHHRTGLHRRMDLVAGAVEEAGVDEDDPVLHRMDTGREVGRGAALLVHDPDLDRMPRQPQQVLDRIEQVIGEAALLRPVHLGFDDIDRAFTTVTDRAKPLQVMHPDQAGDDRIQHALGRIRSVRQSHRRGGHQVADVAHEQQRTARQGHGRSIRGREGPVGIQGPGHRPAALVEGLDQIALHQAQPVAIRRDLVGSVHGGDRVLEIDDGRQGRFQHDVGDARGVVVPDGMVKVEDDLDMQAVVAEQPPARVVADILAGIAEGYAAVRVAEVSP